MKLIITAQMRSGSTYLANLLNSHGECNVYPDYLHVCRFKEAIDAESIDKNLTSPEKTQILGRFYGKNDGLAEISRETGMQLDVQITEKDFNTLLEFYQIALESMRKGARIVGHKTTNAELVVVDLLECVPDVKCIYLYRDPRDVLTSYVKRGLQSMNREGVLKLWKTGVEEILKIKKNDVIGDRIMLIKYEDLINDTHQVLNNISSFLKMNRKLSVNADLTWYGKRFKHNSSFDDTDKKIATNPIGRWKSGRELTPILANKIIGNKLLKCLNFEQYNPSFFQKVRGSTELVTYKVSNFSKRFSAYFD